MNHPKSLSPGLSGSDKNLNIVMKMLLFVHSSQQGLLRKWWPPEIELSVPRLQQQQPSYLHHGHHRDWNDDDHFDDNRDDNKNC